MERYSILYFGTVQELKKTLDQMIERGFGNLKVQIFDSDEDEYCDITGLTYDDCGKEPLKLYTDID